MVASRRAASVALALAGAVVAVALSAPAFRGIEAEHQVRKPVESPATFAGTLMRYLAQ